MNENTVTEGNNEENIIIEENGAENIIAAENDAEKTTQSDKEISEKCKKNGGKNETDYGFIGTVYDAVSVIVASIMIIAVVFTFCFRLVGVDGPSMNDTLSTGDWLIVTPLYTEPEYGQIVISTKKTAAEGNLVKRVIAVAGDKVTVTDEGKVIVNGKELIENYAINNGRRYGNLSYPVTVPDDCVMLMGDNRPVSWDSRFTDIGFAETEYLMGVARIRVAETDRSTGKIKLTKDRNIYANFDKNAND